MSERNYPCEFCDTSQQQEKKLVTITRQRQGQWFIFENVPAWVAPIAATAISMRKRLKQWKNG